MLRKSMGSGLSALTPEEQVLLVAATFWGATARGELQAWFRSDIDRRIRDAIHALSELGAIRLAGIVRANGEQIARMRCEEDFRSIEELLLRSEDQIEELAARYAASTGQSDDGAFRPVDARQA
jgi:hypothetical protein